MSKRKIDAIWVLGLSIVCGLMIWHVANWHSLGMYLEMLTWPNTDKSHWLVLYNLGLMLGMGTALGLLMKKITDLVGYKVNQIRHFDGEDSNHSKDE